MGGLFVLGAAILAAAVRGGMESRHGWLVLSALLALGALGVMDDCMKFRGPNAVGIRTMPKLLASLGIGGLIGWLGMAVPGTTVMQVPWTGRVVDLGALWLPFAMVVIAGCSHAVNLTDGMDGLAAGCLAISLAAAGIWVLQRSPQQHAMVVWCASLAGACVGFLWFNCFPAGVYLGDVGALALGAALGAVSLFTHSALWLPILGGVFVAEALSVMLQVASYKWRNKRRIFRVAPIHHHFHLGGLSEPKVIVRFWLAGLFLALVTLATARPL
jgi:phospho-N-acetylmuramoyl-pentapeptide-transferase